MANENYDCEKIAEGRTERIRSGNLICYEANCPYNNQQALTWEGEEIRLCKTKGTITGFVLEEPVLMLQ